LTVKDLVVTGTVRKGTINGASYDALPVGSIIMFDGDGWKNDVTLPGWYMCNGADSNTPNLTGKFILGGLPSSSGGAYILGATGGNRTVTLSGNQIPSHRHAIAEHVHAFSVANLSISSSSHRHSMVTGGQSATHLDNYLTDNTTYGAFLTQDGVDSGDWKYKLSGFPFNPITNPRPEPNLGLTSQYTDSPTLSMVSNPIGAQTAGTITEWSPQLGTQTSVNIMNPYYTLIFIKKVQAV